ncbi:hypothetical protein TSUD_208430 [Trifolium subterraneum]|uniref:Uncharacterized protein n=1 Tax=Trifolium subterraneum TaxID=3900 RepID=A0A2Z6NQD3_TRISU|nr:hypothetical protein TSUD_208430 [Trifolium subterraneum]
MRILVDRWEVDILWRRSLLGAVSIWLVRCCISPNEEVGDDLVKLLFYRSLFMRPDISIYET